MTTVDKTHQLADWRQRPLPLALQQYAAADTHYLLDIYERLKWDLQQQQQQQQQQGDSAIRDVLDKSRLVSLIRYAPEPFYVNGYQKLLRRGRHQLLPHQEAVLKAVWDWRDGLARRLDESVLYCLTNAQLMRLALAAPTALTQLQALFNPLPVVVLRHSQELLQVVQRAVKEEGNRNEADDHDDDDDDNNLEVSSSTVAATTSSAFFKPAHAEQKRRGMMSPVLGTEQLYEEAGWMTPSNKEQDGAEGNTDTTTTTDEDEKNEGTAASGKPNKLLSVHASNRDYRSSKEAGAGRGSTADGMGSVRAAGNKSVEEESKHAREQASRIQSGMAAQKKSIPAVLGLVASEVVSEEDDIGGNTANDPQPPTDDTTTGGLEQDFRIPRSIREIYMISNRNRRNKKTGTPTPERGVTPTTEKEREELAKAEALLAQSGDAVAAYFDDTDVAPGKRPRTKSGSGESSPDPTSLANMPSKEEDMAFMKDIGWIKGNEDVESLTKLRQGRGRGYEGGDLPASVVGVTYNPGRPNPFFAGAAMQGGALAQQGGGKSDRSSKRGGGGNKGKQSNRNRGGQQQERPEKKDARSHAYRKR